MFVRASAILAAASLLSTSTALPTTERPASTLALRDNGECPAGKNYYVCNIGDFHYKGCCSVDPCTLRQECPDDKPTDPPAPTCAPGSKNKAYQPVMKTIVPGQDPIVGADFHVEKSGTTQTDQIMTFRLPKEAKTCYLHWGVPEKREFRVEANGNPNSGDSFGLTNAQVVDEQGHAGENVGKADFTNWPQVTGPHDHNVGAVTCQEELNVQLTLDNIGEVFLKQNEQTGWYVEYDC